VDLNRDLHVNQARILAVCMVFRNRREAPARMADEMDDPMPVETGDAGTNSVVSTAMLRLTQRFDEFAEAMRKDAAGLVRALQRYRDVQTAILSDLEEVARSLEQRAGTATPGLTVRPPENLPPTQAPAVPRTRTWEAVDPPVGRDVARHLGEPESLRALAQALHKGADGMNDLIGELQRQLNDLVPNDWDGEGAKGFKAQIEQQLRTGKTVAVESTRKVGDALNELAEELNKSWVLFAEAELLAMRFDLTIHLNFGDSPRVDPRVPDAPVPNAREWSAAIERCQKLVESAVTGAAQARGYFRLVLAQAFNDREEIVRPVAEMLLAAASILLGLRRRRTPTASALAAQVRALQTAPRIPLGRVARLPRHMINPDGTPTAEGGRLMHRRIARLIRREYPGVLWDDRGARLNAPGADMRVIGYLRGVRHPGFDYLEIKHDSPGAMQNFVHRQWGRPAFAGHGRIVVYDTRGNVSIVDSPFWSAR